MKKRVLIVLLCFVGALSSAFAAEKKVQGVVISSEDNLPLIGASVYVTAEDLKKAGSVFFIQTDRKSTRLNSSHAR